MTDASCLKCRLIRAATVLRACSLILVMISTTTALAAGVDSSTSNQTTIKQDADTSTASEQTTQRIEQQSESAKDSLPPALKLLSDRCLHCHNDDDAKGDLSLQTNAGLIESGMVQPGAADESHLLTVVTRSADETAPLMPKDSQPLSSDEIQLLRSWIADGAAWPAGLQLQEPIVDNFDWWSLKPVSSPEVPGFDEVEPVAWIRNPIDAFVWQKLTAEKLKPSPEADRRVLIRRLTFDLTGLPPTPEEIEAFTSDDSGDAWEQLVDRLLASPRYGERWARHWLDVVKYADTCGYDKDKLRPNAWPYRDYVIRSFNEDKPYGRFVQEQIAGDALFPGEPDGILGLGFLAAGPWDFIGHVEVPESKIDGKVARNLDRDDMVSNVMNTFCSVTIQCARCHNHKFDPFTQEHYYGLQAVFAAVDRADRPYDTDPGTEQQRNQLAARQSEIKQQLSALEKEIENDGGSELKELQTDIARLKSLVAPKDKKPEFGFHSQIASSANTTKWVQVDLGNEVEIHRIVLNPCHDDFGGIGAGFGFPNRFAVTLHSAEPDVESESTADAMILNATTADFPNPGLMPVTIDLPSARLARFVRITATKLTERQNDYILAIAEIQVLNKNGVNTALGKVVTSLDSIEAPVRWSRSNLTDGIWAQSIDEAANTLLVEAQQKLGSLLQRINSPERLKRREHLQSEQSEIEKQIASLPRGRMVYAAATHFDPQGNFKPTGGIPRTIHVLHRGNETQPKHVAWPGVVPLSQDARTTFELPENHSEADRRAALALWITQPEHPLTWRTITNRIWQHHFESPVVDSPNDFGRMGQLPTHPELLDWLTQQFLSNGQSIKALQKLIVMSATYRQSSDNREDGIAADSGNQYLWRMNRRKLSAEELRDSILAVSGKLDLQMGGPGYYLFDLEKPEHSPHYEYSKFDPNDSRSHRRSIYRFIVRSQPDPFMTVLDCADSSQSTPKRNETLTSLQALSLLNNAFNLAMARHFASDIQSASSSRQDQIRVAFSRVTGRHPTLDEFNALTIYAETHGLDNMCRMLFNLSEFIFID